MSLFCATCNNLLEALTTADSFQFQCIKCTKITEPTASDTLRYSEGQGTNLQVYRAILFNAGKDPVNPKVRKECKCGNNTVRQVQLGSEMKLINTCVACNEQWLDGTRETD